MTPKEKAISIYNEFMNVKFPTHADRAKICALIVCDEMYLEYKELGRVVKDIVYKEGIKYWNDVRKEIKKL